MQELESGDEPADLEIEAPPGLLPDLAEWGIEEIERGVCEDTFENRRTIRQNKAKFNTVFDSNGNPTPYLQVISAEMYSAAQALSKADLLTDPDDHDSDYLRGLKLLLAPNSKHLAPTWVINTTRTFMRQQERKRELGPDADLMQTRLVAEPARCSVKKSDGTRCWGWASGASDTNGMCKIHARRVNRLPAQTMSTAQIMRNRLDSAAPGILDKLERLTESDDERIALTAARDLLDRAGYKAVDYTETKVEVTVNDAAEEVKKRLAKLKQGQDEKAKLLKQIHDAQNGGETVEAEVVEDE